QMVWKTAFFLYCVRTTINANHLSNSTENAHSIIQSFKAVSLPLLGNGFLCYFRKNGKISIKKPKKTHFFQKRY
ncbi:MAG: hypothetical protein IKV16_00540, partial [Clostridia bacterium]|nr:hypothetical protein [Clostridia bacterium]